MRTPRRASRESHPPKNEAPLRKAAPRHIFGRTITARLAPGGHRKARCRPSACLLHDDFHEGRCVPLIVVEDCDAHVERAFAPIGIRSGTAARTAGLGHNPRKQVSVTECERTGVLVENTRIREVRGESRAGVLIHGCGTRHSRDDRICISYGNGPGVRPRCAVVVGDADLNRIRIGSTGRRQLAASRSRIPDPCRGAFASRTLGSRSVSEEPFVR
jgi:hypothetical protein